MYGWIAGLICSCSCCPVAEGNMHKDVWMDGQAVDDE